MGAYVGFLSGENSCAWDLTPGEALQIMVSYSLISQRAEVQGGSSDLSKATIYVPSLKNSVKYMNSYVWVMGQHLITSLALGWGGTSVPMSLLSTFPTAAGRMLWAFLKTHSHGSHRVARDP